MVRHNHKAIKRYLRLTGGDQSDGLQIQQVHYEWSDIQKKSVELQFTDPKSFLRGTLIPGILAVLTAVPLIGEFAIVAEIGLAASIATATLTLVDDIQNGADPLTITVDVLNIVSRAAGVKGFPKGLVTAAQKLGQLNMVLSKLSFANNHRSIFFRAIGAINVNNPDGTTTGPLPGTPAYFIRVDEICKEIDIQYGRAYSSIDELRDPDGGPADLCLRFTYFPNNCGWSNLPKKTSFIGLVNYLEDNVKYAEFPKFKVVKEKFPILQGILNKYYDDKFKSYSLKDAVLQAYQDYIKTLSSIDYDEAVIIADTKLAIQNQSEIYNKPIRVATSETATSNATNMANLAKEQADIAASQKEVAAQKAADAAKAALPLTDAEKAANLAINLSKVSPEQAAINAQNAADSAAFVAQNKAMVDAQTKAAQDLLASQSKTIPTSSLSLLGGRHKKGGASSQDQPLPKQFTDPKFKRIWLYTARDGTLPDNAMRGTPPQGLGSYAPLIQSDGWLSAKENTMDTSQIIIPVAHESNAKPIRKGINNTNNVSLCANGKPGTEVNVYGGYYSGPVNQFGYFNPVEDSSKIPCLTQWNVYYPDNPDVIGNINDHTITTGTINYNFTDYNDKLKDKSGAYTNGNNGAVGNIGAIISFWKPPSNTLPQAIAANGILAYFYCIQSGTLPLAIDIIQDYLSSSEQIQNSTAVVNAAIPLWEAENQVTIATEVASFAYENDNLVSKILTLDQQAALSVFLTEGQFDEIMRKRSEEQVVVAQTSIDAKANLDAKEQFRDDLLAKYNSAVVKFQEGWAKFYSPLYTQYWESGGKIDDVSFSWVKDILTYAKSYSQFNYTTTDKVIVNDVYDTFVQKLNKIDEPNIDVANWAYVSDVKSVIDEYFRIVTSQKMTPPKPKFGDKFDNLLASTWSDWFKTLVEKLYTANDPLAVSDSVKFITSVLPSDSKIFTPYVLQSAQKAFEYYKNLIKTTPTKFDSAGKPTNAIYPPALFYSPNNAISIESTVSSMSATNATSWMVYYGRYINPNVGYYKDDSDSLITRDFPELASLFPRIFYKNVIPKLPTQADIQQSQASIAENAKLGVIDTPLAGGFATRKHHGTPAYMLTHYRMRNRL